MQVFLPYSDFSESVKCLDNKRLGNQIYRECLTLIKGGWPNHPASKIWAGHKRSLAEYSLAGLVELEKRGRYYPHHFKTFEEYLSLPDTGTPDLVGYEPFHLSHRSNLLRKNKDHYSKFFGNDIPLDIPYIWKK